MKRYIKEYANDKIRRIRVSGVDEQLKAESVRIIENSVTLRKRGLLTDDETMMCIENAEHSAYKILNGSAE